MSDPCTRIFRLAMKWKRTSGGLLLTVLGAIGTFAWTQWAGRDARISNLESAQTQAYTQSKLEEQTVSTIATELNEFRSEYRQDASDFRRALMIPRPNTRTTSFDFPGETARIP